MRKRVLVYGLCLLGVVSALSAKDKKGGALYKDAKAPIEKRVDDLLSRMTLEEKVMQLNQYTLGRNNNVNNVGEEVKKVPAEIGSLIYFETNPELRNNMQKKAMEESRLGIPIIFGYDAIHGFRTVYPISLAQACSWNPDLVEQACAVSAQEARMSGVDWTFSPMIDVARDPRWGRVAEGYGEDPYANGVFGAASVRGYQGDNLSAENRVAACLKHYVGYGASEAGRDYVYTEISKQTLWDTYLLPYEMGVKAGAATLMSSFNDISGVPGSANPYTMTEILKNRWRHDGFIVSDWGAIEQLKNQGLAATKKEAAWHAFTAGLEMDMMSHAYDRHLQELVEEGKVSMAQVDEAVRRTDTGQMDTYGPNAPDGIVGANREKEGSFYTVREVWSPIQIHPLKITSSFKGDFYVTNDYLFSNLSECRMKWKVMRLPIPQVSDSPICLAEGGVLLPAIQPGEKGIAHFDLPEKFFNGDILELEAYNVAGDMICNWTFPIKNNRKYFIEYRYLQPTTTATARYQTDDNSVTLIANGVTATFNKANGNLVEVKNGSKIIPLSDGPLPVGMKMLFCSANLKMQGDTAIYTVKYKGAADSIVWRMAPDGLLGMDALVLNYRAKNKFDGVYFDRPVLNFGFSFSFPEKNISGMRWLGKGPYRVWKNRIEGTNYGIWQKDYNNTVTGEYYHQLIYPEFKGYHADLYWATLQSKTTPMTVYSETDGIFFRVFTPEEQRDRESRGISVNEYPAGDLSFLFEIPAVNSQGTGGEASYIKINKGDDGFRMKLWFDFRN